MTIKRVYEPEILALGSFGLYICSLFVLLLIAALGGCGWKGACSAPVVEFSILMLLHWIIVAAIMKNSIAIARWLLIISGVIPLILISTLHILFSESDPSYLMLIVGYLLIFGIIFPAYLFFSKEVAEYEKYLIAKRRE